MNITQRVWEFWLSGNCKSSFLCKALMTRVDFILGDLMNVKGEIFQHYSNLNNLRICKRNNESITGLGNFTIFNFFV